MTDTADLKWGTAPGELGSLCQCLIHWLEVVPLTGAPALAHF